MQYQILLVESFSVILNLLVTDWRYVFVADFEALTCQVTRKFIRCRNAEIPTIAAIKYTACYKLAVLVFGHSVFHFCCIVFLSVRWGRQALLQVLVLALAGATCKRA